MAQSSLLRFPYIKGRPYILVELGFLKNRFRYFRLLIDSGADYTLISEKDAILLGLSYNKIRSKITQIETANGTSVSTKKTMLNMKIDSFAFKVPVLITKENVECLLGRKGVFDHFDVIFQESQQQVIFKK